MKYEAGIYNKASLLVFRNNQKNVIIVIHLWRGYIRFNIPLFHGLSLNNNNGKGVRNEEVSIIPYSFTNI